MDMFTRAEELHRETMKNYALLLSAYKQQYAEELVGLMDGACGAGHFKCEYLIHADDPVKVQAWEEIAAVLAQEGYKHTLVWSAEGGSLMGIEVSW